jgi:polyferredoxin
MMCSITLQAAGDWLQRHQDVVRRLQWSMALVYYALLATPVLLPPPASRADIFHSVAGAAEVLFWGIWWPGVILSMLLFGQFWCGVFCPDGVVTEFASRHGRGGKIPAWVRWAGWPILAFSVVAVYEHLMNAHQTPRALFVSLGGASLLALVCGYFFGRGKRVWCRYLCPASGIFSLLARCSIFHFRVDRETWDKAPRPLPRSIDCPPLLDVRRLRGNEKCSMCGRCSGHRNAVVLAARWPGSEVVDLMPAEIRRADAFAICFVLIGLCFGAMYWRALGLIGPFWRSAPPVSLTAILAIVLIAASLGGFTALLLLVAARARPRHAAHLAYALIPLAGLGLFAGALEHSFLLLEEAGFAVVTPRQLTRCVSLTVGALWSIFLARRIFSSWGERAFPGQTLFALLVAALGCGYFSVPEMMFCHIAGNP